MEPFMKHLFYSFWRTTLMLHVAVMMLSERFKQSGVKVSHGRRGKILFSWKFYKTKFISSDTGLTWKSLKTLN